MPRTKAAAPAVSIEELIGGGAPESAPVAPVIEAPAVVAATVAEPTPDLVKTAAVVKEASVVTAAPVASRKEVPVAPLQPRMARTPRSFVPAQAKANPGYHTGAPMMGGRRLAAANRGEFSGRQAVSTEPEAPTVMLKGFLDTTRDGHGVVRETFAGGDRDAYIAASQVRRFRLKPGDYLEGPGREPKENERYWGFVQVEKVNGQPADELARTERIKFQSLTPVYPDQKINLETGDEPLSLRMIDIFAPIGKGQRSLIVSPPKAGKTTLLKEIATGVANNHPEIHLIAVLVGERPEEVTDIRRHIEKITKGQGETAASNFDEAPEDQCRVAELALERAKRLVESGRDVMILLDSITRLARAYNLSIPTSGRTLSGGFDPAAIHPTKRFFGAARNFEVPGSLTIVGTALVDTGSRMDDVIFEEFKGTGNQEIILDRRLAERRIFPSMDVFRSGTRRDDLLFDAMTYQSILTLQRMLDTLDKEERTPMLIEQMKRTKSNKEFLASLKSS